MQVLQGTDVCISYLQSLDSFHSFTRADEGLLRLRKQALARSIRRIELQGHVVVDHGFLPHTQPRMAIPHQRVRAVCRVGEYST